MDENLKKAKEALAKKDDKIAELKGEKVISSCIGLCKRK